MTHELTSALSQLLKNVVREVAADLIKEWKASTSPQSPLKTPVDGVLLLTPLETAERLAISERLLFQLTRSGQLPCVRVGKCVRYSIETIHKWVREAESTVQPSSTKTHSPTTRAVRSKTKSTARQK